MASLTCVNAMVASKARFVGGARVSAKSSITRVGGLKAKASVSMRVTGTSPLDSARVRHQNDLLRYLGERDDASRAASASIAARRARHPAALRRVFIT